MRSVIKITLILLSISTISINTYASGFGALGVGGRLIKSDDGNYEGKVSPQIYGGIRNGTWAYAGELLYYTDSSVAGSNYSMKYDHYEFSGYVLKFVNYEEDRAINPYAVAGIGTYQERLEANFNGQKDKDTSKYYLTAKAGAGAWAQLGSTMFMNLELKANYSAHFTPDIVFDVSTRLGLEF